MRRTYIVLFFSILVVGFLGYWYMSPYSPTPSDSEQKEKSLPPLRYDYASGTQLKYQFSLSKKTSVSFQNQQSAGNNAGSRMASNINLEGVWIITVYRSSNENGYLLGWRMKNPSIHTFSKNNRENNERIKSRLQKQLSKEIYVKLSKNGRPYQFNFPSNVSSIAEGIWQEWIDVSTISLPNHNDFQSSRNPRRQTWTIQRKNLQGMYKATIKRTGKRTLRKTKKHYMFVPNETSLSPGTDIEGSDHYTWDLKNGYIKQGSGSITLDGSILTKGKKGSYSAKRSFSYQFLQQSKADTSESIDNTGKNASITQKLQNSIVRDIGEQTPSPRQPQNSIDFKKLQSTLSKYIENPGDVPRNKNVIARAVSFIHQDPERSTHKIQKRLSRSDTPLREKTTWLNVLALSQNVTAHSLLANTIKNNQDILGKQALRALLWNIKTPSDDLRKAVETALETGGENTPYFRESLRATGALISHLNPLSKQGKQLFHKLRNQRDRIHSQQDKIAYLDAIGNSYHRGGFREARQFLEGNHSDKVNEAAARALQNIPRPQKITRYLLQYAEKQRNNAVVLRTVIASLVNVQIRVSSPPHQQKVRKLLESLLKQHPNKLVRKEAFRYFTLQSHIPEKDVKTLFQYVARNDPFDDLRHKAKKKLKSIKKKKTK